MVRTAVSARLGLVLGVAGLVAMALGAAGAGGGILTPFVGFRVFLLGALVGLVSLAFGIAGVIATRPARGRPGAAQAWAAVAFGVLALAVVATSGAPGAGVPAINDITTDTADPPVFVAATRHEANRGRDMAGLDENTIQQQVAAYGLSSIQLAAAPPEALALCERAARSLGWEIVEVAAAEGRLEAYQVTRIFRFVDDVVVRVRPSPTGVGSVIDVRSKSRDGKGDVGANAARIRAFAAALTESGNP